MIQRTQKPTIKLLNIDFNYKTDNVGYNINKEDNNLNIDYLGKYPYVSFQNVLIEPQDISYLKIFNSQFLPMLEINFTDPKSVFNDEKLPLDDSAISIFIRSSSEVLRPIRMDFKVLNFSINKNNGGNSNLVEYHLLATLHISELFYTPFRAMNDTSFNVLKTLSTENKLGFATNIKDTVDKMGWINPSYTVKEFMEHVTMRSYLNDSSFLFSFIDFYYNLNYVDIETELKESTNDQYQIFENDIKKDKNDMIVTKLILNNHPDYANSNLYIDKYFISNDSTDINFRIGYSTVIYEYENNQEKLNIMGLDTISTTGKNNIILKGQPQDENGLYKNNQNNIYIGKYDNDNVHQNYYYAKKQNENNLEYIQKIKMKLILSRPNFNLDRFRLVNVQLYKFNPTTDNISVPTDMTDPKAQQTDIHRDSLNTRLSGDWLITGINYTFSTKDGFQQEVNLTRRELSAFEPNNTNTPINPTVSY